MGHYQGDAAGWQRTIKLAASLAVILIPLLAFKTTFMFLQNMWTAGGDFVQEKVWGALYDNVDGDPYYLCFWGVNLGANITFIIACILLSIVDLTGWPAFLLRYKVQEDKNVPLEPKRLMHAIKVVMINQAIVGVPATYLMFKATQWRGCDFDRTIPSFTRFALEFVFCVLMEEVCFYYSHRLLHHPTLYKTIHKMHHEWTAPIGIVAIYCHPLEHVLSNLVPVFIGPLLCGAHMFTAGVWAVLALFTTTMIHSGYHLPFLPSPEAHDYHHLKFNQCYGVIGILDDLHGTNDQFKASVQYKRHYFTLGLTPVSELYPDTTSTNKME